MGQIKSLGERYLIKKGKIEFDIKYVLKIKDKYTYKVLREVNKPSWVGIVPVKLLIDRSLFKNKK